MCETVAKLNDAVTQLMSELRERDKVVERELDSLGNRADRHREELEALHTTVSTLSSHGDRS
jgi:hypothetical protein